MGNSEKITLDTNDNSPQDSYDDVQLRAPKVKPSRGSSKRKKGVLERIAQKKTVQSKQKGVGDENATMTDKLSSNPIDMGDTLKSSPSASKKRNPNNLDAHPNTYNATQVPLMQQNIYPPTYMTGYPMMYDTDGAPQVNHQQQSDVPFFLTSDQDRNQSFVSSECPVPMFYMPSYPGGPVRRRRRLHFEDSSRA
ncbi:hypothetical protein IFM89_016051 [Coptis chinensis]|uniref:Uncharacterized protein n=1 Tax=Coptis chinensis TaxID=261450 RepID=A0A835HQ56_9MAGN|nr:hypothetical protein IFM89_016051 [Coptis chinensis]